MGMSYFMSHECCDFLQPCFTCSASLSARWRRWTTEDAELVYFLIELYLTEILYNSCGQSGPVVPSLPDLSAVGRAGLAASVAGPGCPDPPQGGFDRSTAAVLARFTPWARLLTGGGGWSRLFTGGGRDCWRGGGWSRLFTREGGRGGSLQNWRVLFFELVFIFFLFFGGRPHIDCALGGRPHCP